MVPSVCYFRAGPCVLRVAATTVGMEPWCSLARVTVDLLGGLDVATLWGVAVVAGTVLASRWAVWGLCIFASMAVG